MFDKAFGIAILAAMIGAFVAMFIFSLVGGDDAAAKLKEKIAPSGN